MGSEKMKRALIYIIKKTSPKPLDPNVSVVFIKNGTSAITAFT